MKPRLLGVVGMTVAALLTVAAGSPPVSATITISVAMTIAPGVMPGSYAGQVAFDFLPGTQ